MLRMFCCVLMSTCMLLTTTALPIAVANKKDSKFCCKCTVEGEESTGCSGGLTATVISGIDGGFINTVGGGLINAYVGGSSIGLVPSIQIRVPQVQFPAPINIVPLQQYLLYNLQPLQAFFNIQQPKVSTQCCMPCPDGNGICCCKPGETTTTPRDSHTLHSPYHPAGAQTPLKSNSLFINIIILLVFDHIL
ncbi:hypothetical protein LOAG_04906 [Loa loa]|uniref:Secreted protein n=1 Tax=Loa loa TaxID=7209 RepID=A0A1I7VT25_LOALO|nr:hypothetical protein LOAG_04906 [Loa loa]EFO23576.1 hypothetical protein LOAG_04906 [Loa loa]